MTKTLGTAIIWHADDYILFKRCGEITISPDIKNIGFNCLFCPGICLQSEIFIQHLQEQHADEVFKLYEDQTSITALDTNKFRTELIVNLNECVDDNLMLTNNTCVESHQLQNKQNQELKTDCIDSNVLPPMEENQMPTSDLDLVYEIEANDFLMVTSQNQDLENLITTNSHENILNNSTASNSNTSTLNCNTTTSFTIPYNCISTSSGICKCLPEVNVCEKGDDEDSGIMLGQSPCHSDCGGLSDCMLFTEDSSSKSDHNGDYTKLSEVQNKPETKTNSFKRKYFKTVSMRKALNNKDLIKYLLEAYRKNEKLWNPKHPSYIYNAPRAIYEELSEPLLNDKKYLLSGEEIFGIITKLRGRYRRELKKFEIRKGKHKTRLWYFENLEFLRQTIEEKRKERVKNKDDSGIANVQNNNLTNRQVLSYVLDLYHQNECLWNPRHMKYHTCNRTDLYKEITEELKNKRNIDMTHFDCLNEIKKLRIRYHKELRVLYNLKGLYIPKLWCFDEMEFLRPVIEEKIIKTNNRNQHSHTLRKNNFQKAKEIKFVSLEQQLEFIDIYHSYNSLWNVDHPDYRSTYYQRKALNNMLLDINLNIKTEKKFKLEQLEKTLYLLRKDFSKEKGRRLTKTDFNKKTGMSFVLYEKLNEFLDVYLGPFRCNNCQQICKSYDQYKIHKSRHDGSLPFICTLCSKGFQMPGNLAIHIRRHRKDFPYSCEICKKSFATSTEVRIHKRSHTGERPYACELCNKTFKTWSFYNLHRRAHINQSNFHCPICDKAFYERNRFTDHMNVHLNIRKHQCEECGKGFTTMGNLKKHSDLHAPIKKYKCHYCGKSFAQFASLRWHRKTQHEQL